MPLSARRGGPDSPRIAFSIGEGWRYADGPVAGAEHVDFDDSGWEPVRLPHTWNARDALDKSGFRRGVGWYRRRLEIEPALAGRRLFLRFEGANQVADVFVNGRPAGRHVGGYTAFALDITGLARPGAANRVAVRVDNGPDPDVPPLEADFTFYGGLYRDAWLIATAPVHLAVLDHGSPGVLVDTPEVSEAAAVLRVRGTVVSAEDREREAEVVSRLLDAEGREVASVATRVALPAGAEAAFEQRARIDRPRLWSPDDPRLYDLCTAVRLGGRAVDEVRVPLGFRWIGIDPERGFTLNGRPLRLTGTNRHQDRAGLGNALPAALHREDIDRIRDDGFVFIRLAHYPQDPAVLEACDRRGLVVWMEIPVVNRIGLSDAFGEHAERMLVEMIRQHASHPSVAFWGIANEVLLRPPEPRPPDYAARVVALLRRLHARARAEDPSRPTALALSLDEIDDGTGARDVTDVLGLNLYLGWYSEALGDLGPFLDAFHARHPRRPAIVSEYGAEGDGRVHAREPRALDSSAEYQRLAHESWLPQLEARTWLLGSAVWNQFDFGSRARDGTTPNLNSKGLYRFDRSPKDVAWYYRARLSREPVLHLACRDGAVLAGSRPGDERRPVAVYSNLDEVELWRGDEPLGRRRVENATARWEVTLRAGENVLVARGEHRGRMIEDRGVITYEDRRPLFGDAAPEGAAIAVNCGADWAYRDRAGVVWEPDRAHAPGSWGAIGGVPRLDRHRVLGTDDDALYQASLDGAFEYRFDVPEGRYELDLRFGETQHDRAGERLFGVSVNGTPVIEGLDLAREHGRYAAAERRLIARGRGPEGLRVAFAPRAGSATVSGIRVRRLPE